MDALPPRTAETLARLAAYWTGMGGYVLATGRVNDPARAVAYCAAVERAAVGRRAEAAIRGEGLAAALALARRRAAHFGRLRPLEGLGWWREARLSAWRDLAEAMDRDLAEAENSASAELAREDLRHGPRDMEGKGGGDYRGGSDGGRRAPPQTV